MFLLIVGHLVAFAGPDAAPPKVAGGASLVLAKRGPSTAAPGVPLTYTLSVTNAGEGLLMSVVVTDALPAYATYVGGGTLVNGNVVSWTVPFLLPGNSTDLSFQVTASRTISNSDYRAHADGGVSVTGDTIVVTNIPHPRLEISKSAPTAVFIGQPISYVLTVRNQGELTATNLVISDVLPSGAHYAGGGRLEGGDTIIWPIAALGPNGAEVSVTLLLTANQTITNAYYGVFADDGVSALGDQVVQTLVTPVPLIFMPAFMRDFTFSEPNDVCSSAFPLLPNRDYYLLPDDKDDWYVVALTGPGSQSLLITLDDFFPLSGQLAVFAGANCGDAVFLASNGETSPSKSVFVGPQPPGLYYVYVSNDGWLSLTTPYRLHVHYLP